MGEVLCMWFVCDSVCVVCMICDILWCVYMVCMLCGVYVVWGDVGGEGCLCGMVLFVCGGGMCGACVCGVCVYPIKVLIQ